jgi:hypothetical protein
MRCPVAQQDFQSRLFLVPESDAASTSTQGLPVSILRLVTSHHCHQPDAVAGAVAAPSLPYEGVAR